MELLRLPLGGRGKMLEGRSEWESMRIEGEGEG